MTVEALLPIPEVGRTFVTERRVRLGDASPGGRLRLDAAARYLQDIARDDAVDGGLDGEMGWVVRRTTIEVGRPPVFGELVRLTTFCSGFGGRWAERRTVIEGDADGRIEAVALWVHLDAASGRPLKLTPRFHEVYGEAARGRKVGARLHHPDPPPGLEQRGWPLRFCDFDVLAHVNNAVYWSVVEEELAERGLKTPLRAEVEHRSAIERGHEVAVSSTDLDEGAVGVWLNAGGEVRASARIVAERARRG